MTVRQMQILAPWIGLFGPFLMAALVLLAARVARPAAQAFPLRKAAPGRGGGPAAVPGATAWQDTCDEARRSLRPRYPYFG